MAEPPHRVPGEPTRLSEGGAGGPMGGFGHGGAFGGAGAVGAQSVAFGHNGGAGDPFTALGRQVTKIMTNRAVTSWGNPTTRLWQIICGGRPPSMQKAAVQGYVGEKVDISARVHTMLENMDSIDSWPSCCAEDLA